MSYDPEYSGDRWDSGNDPCCPYCGRRVKSSEDCRCSTAPAVVEAVTPMPSGGHLSLYPPIRMTPEQLAAWRKQCDEYDAAVEAGAFRVKREEPTTPEPDPEEVEAVVRRYGR